MICRYLRIVIILWVLSASGCIELTSGKRYQNDYIVVAGALIAGKPITMENPIFIGRTIDIDNFYLERMVLPDLLVYIENVKTAEKQFLSYSDNISDSLYNQPILNIGYYDLSDSFIIDHLTKYRIVAKIGADSVWAETSVPDSFVVEFSEFFTADVHSVFPAISYNELVDLEPLQIIVNKKEEMTIQVEYYCLQEWETAYWVFADKSDQTPQSALEYENIISGYPRKKVVTNTYLPEFIDDKYTILLPIAQNDFLFYGEYRIRISIVDDNISDYKNNKSGFYSGGINNGIGYFGSIATFDVFTNIQE